MSLLETLEQELNQALTKMLELEDQREALDAALGTATKEFNQLNRAYAALTGTDAHSSSKPEALVLVQSLPVPLPVAHKASSGPTCNGCGGEMEPGYRTLQNGRTINLWICKDSGCNNESLG